MPETQRDETDVEEQQPLQHKWDCEWHFEQYPWECTCGLTLSNGE